MKTDESIKMLSDQAFLNKLYGYAYHRCRTSQEAEDLCSEIILDVLHAIHNGRKIGSFYAFVWTVARRTYADFCEKRKAHSGAVITEEYSDRILNISENQIDDFIEKEEEKERFVRIFKEISFLSKIYRDVMIMYYLDEMKVSDIAVSLGISETTVKQRLFSARNTIKKEVQKMENRNLSLKPVNLQFIVTGNPVGNDACEKARERLLSQNLIYLCKNEAKTAKELSEALCVPMPYIEDEIEIQCYGLNGSYGLLRNLGNGKYISNILIVDEEERKEANGIYAKYSDEIFACLKKTVESSKDKILSFPFLSKQQDVKFILWSLISNPVWIVEKKISEILAEKYFADIEPVKRDYTTVAIDFHEIGAFKNDFIGCDGVTAGDLCGYSQVFFANIYSDRIEKHFGCGYNLSTDPRILLTVRSIGGLDISSLSEAEKEAAAKAVECGYMRKNGAVLDPKILVFREEDRSAFFRLLSGFNDDAERIAGKIAEDIAVYIKKHLPKHLVGEYPYYNELIAASSILHDIIEVCIREGLLLAPENKICAEGTYMTVKK